MEANNLTEILWGLLGIIGFLSPMIVSQRRKHEHSKLIGILTLASLLLAVFDYRLMLVAWVATLLWSIFGRKR